MDNMAMTSEAAQEIAHALNKSVGLRMNQNLSD
jgi:hypothetical protein